MDIIINKENIIPVENKKWFKVNRLIVRNCDITWPSSAVVKVTFYQKNKDNSKKTLTLSDYDRSESGVIQINEPFDLPINTTQIGITLDNSTEIIVPEKIALDYDLK